MDPSEMNWQSVISDPTDINLGYLPHPRDNILQVYFKHLPFHRIYTHNCRTDPTFYLLEILPLAC